MFEILYDPGHGGSDRYNVGYSKEYIEADGVLRIGKYFKEIMESTYTNVVVDLTRDKDKTVSLTDRGLMAVKYDLFLSSHTNASENTSVRGVEGYHSVDIPSDRELTQLLCDAIAGYFNVNNRGAKTRPGTYDPTEDYYTVIDVAQDVGCPHVILMEWLFHSNEISEKILLSDDNLHKIASIAVDVIGTYFNLKKNDQADNWALEAQEWAKQMGISDGTRPKDNITRQEAWQMFYNYFNNIE